MVRGVMGAVTDRLSNITTNVGGGGLLMKKCFLTTVL